MQKYIGSKVLKEFLRYMQEENQKEYNKNKNKHKIKLQRLRDKIEVKTR